MERRRIGILTGGGDAPGLNAVIRAVVKFGVGQKGWDIMGSEDAFCGFLDSPKRIHPLTPQSCQGLLHRGGTILGTTNKGDPFHWIDKDGAVRDRSLELAGEIRALGLEGLVVIGGDGTQRIAQRLMETHGIPVIGVPKTIDNDLAVTDFTFGFWSAVEVATEAIDRLHTTAEAHDRVMILEVMGRTAGWIALYAGVAGGADCIAIPELPYHPEKFCEKIVARQKKGRHFTIIVVAEGATAAHSSLLEEPPRTGYPSSAGHRLAEEIGSQLKEVDTRVTVLGHLQRGGGPVPYDRVLATQFGVHAAQLVEQKKWGQMVALKAHEVSHVPLAEVAGPPREVAPTHSLIETARAVGICFGHPTDIVP